jgi:hypothetical protein
MFTAHHERNTAFASPTLLDAILAAELASPGTGPLAHVPNHIKFLAGGAAGIVASLAAALATGAGAHPAYGAAIGVAATIAVQVLRSHMRSVEARMFDSEACQATLARIRGTMGRATMAARRSGAWIVHRPGAGSPEVMTESEYAAFRTTVADLREIVAEARCLRVTALRMGSPILDADGTPAATRIDFASGRLTRGDDACDGLALADADAPAGPRA